jgi:hypothetical protein
MPPRTWWCCDGPRRVATERTCPVCGEAFAGSPARCHRCETVLGSWWRFEDELGGLAPQAPPASRAALTVAGVLAVVAMALLVALVRKPAAVPETRGPSPRPEAPPPTPPASVAAAARPASVRYTVQSGDSPWRIAAALTGQGWRWRELWPDSPPRLVPGMVLDLPVDTGPR